MCDEYNFEKKNAIKRGVEICQSGSGDWDVSKSESKIEERMLLSGFT